MTPNTEKGMDMDMKKMLSLLMVAVMLVSLFGCVAKSSHAEELLIAARAIDLDTMSAHAVLPKTSSAVPFAQEKVYAAQLQEEEKNVLVSLYAMLQYTMGEESSVEDGVKTVAVTLKAPDFTRIKSLVHTEILVSGKSAEQIVSGMIENGLIEKSYMTEKKITVKMVEQDGEFYVSCYEKDNAELFDALALLDMLRFFATN